MSNMGGRQEDRRLADERFVDALLAEAGLPDDAGLRDVLLEMRSRRVTEVPQPSAGVAALMVQPGLADVVQLEGWPRKHRRKSRAVFTSLAVAASLGIAGGAAAGNDGVRSEAEGTIRNIITSFTNPAPTTPAPASPAGTPEPAPAVVPVPTRTTPVGTVPAAPAAVQVPGSEPSAPNWLGTSDGPNSEAPNSGAPGRLSRVPEEAEVSSTFPPGGGNPAAPGASDAPAEPPGAGSSAGGSGFSDGGNGNGKAASGGMAGQEAGQPKPSPTNRR